MTKFTHTNDALGYWTSGYCPKLVSTGGYYRNHQLGNQFRSSVMSELEYDIVSGLTEGMDMINLARFREYVDGRK